MKPCWLVLPLFNFCGAKRWQKKSLSMFFRWMIYLNFLTLDEHYGVLNVISIPSYQTKKYFKEIGIPADVKYIDPTYMIRACRANASDGILCTVLGQNAVSIHFFYSPPLSMCSHTVWFVWTAWWTFFSFWYEKIAWIQTSIA